MLYFCEVKEINYGYIEVDAKSPTEAYRLAAEQYDGGNTVWHRTTYDIDVEESVVE